MSRFSSMLMAGALALSSGIVVASASTPRVQFTCSITQRSAVVCLFKGTGFIPNATVHITYHVSLVVGGQQQNSVIHETRRIDARGTVTRPPLTFTINPLLPTTVFRAAVTMDVQEGRMATGH